MKDELFGFQIEELNKLRAFSSLALKNYKECHIPQVISMQAPTGSGKTIIMAAFIESIFFGNENYEPQPDAVFVWLSDSPQLNAQSKQKIDLKADKIRLNQCVIIEDESFDMEELEDGHIYFLNTQKIGKSGNLCHYSDHRQYTIWDTIQNTAKNKSDRFYFIIDEAHRGSQGREASTATSIMQRFIKGKEELGLDQLPLLIGMSATAQRFNTLIGNTTSTLHKAIVSVNDVRDSGLLKDRILLEHPGENSASNEYSVLQAAVEDYRLKCLHWFQYCTHNHNAQVNPIMVVQVEAGNESIVSHSDLDAILATIEEKLGVQFREGQVVHAFGGYDEIRINGLTVHYKDPVAIADDKLIKVVFFKEALSTGWDCPRAETMMSFRKAVDSTYIAQLLGRMIRTPLGRRIKSDEFLNDVRVFLPCFDMEATKQIIAELSANEGENIPAAIDDDIPSMPTYKPYSIHVRKKEVVAPGQTSLDLDIDKKNESKNNDPSISYIFEQSEKGAENKVDVRSDEINEGIFTITAEEDKPGYNETTVQSQFIDETNMKVGNTSEVNQVNTAYKKESFFNNIDRESIVKFINKSGFLTYDVKTVKIAEYLESLYKLSGLLTRTGIYSNASLEVENALIKQMHSYIEELKKDDTYREKVKEVLQFKLQIQIFDVFGETIDEQPEANLFMLADSDLDRQLQLADAKLGSYGLVNAYGKDYYNPDNENEYKVDCILFVIDNENIIKLQNYAKEKFHELNDKFRRVLAQNNIVDNVQDQYNKIVSNGDVVSKHNFLLPENIIFKVDESGDLYDDHLFADEFGQAKIKLNTWEKEVLEEEQSRDDFICWLRNPSRVNWAFCLHYLDGDKETPFYPDFLIVRKDDLNPNGYIVDVLEPHNPAFADNLGKAKALAKYAQDELKIGRVQLIRQSKNMAGNTKYKRLDMSKGETRDKVLKCMSIEELNHIFDTDGFFDKN